MKSKNTIRNISLLAVLMISSLSLLSFKNKEKNLEGGLMMTSTKSKIANPDDLVFYVQFHLKPESAGEFKESLLKLVNEMAKEETFVSAFLHQDQDDPNKYTIYERWRESSMDAFIINQLEGKEYRNDYEDHIEEWSATPRDISVLKPMNHWINNTQEPTDNDLAFYVNFHIKPEKVAEWKEAALHVLNSMAVEQTFVGAFLHQDANEPTKFTLYERWAEPSMEAFINNQLNAKDYRKVYEEQLPHMVQSPRTFKVLKPTGFWNK